VSQAGPIGPRLTAAGEGGVVEGALLGDQIEAAHQPACRPGDVVGQDGQQREHHAAAHAGVGAVDDASLGIGTGEVEGEVVAGLDGGDGDLVQAAVPLVGLVLVPGRRPAAVGQAGELAAQPGLGVVHHALHHGLDRVRAVLVDQGVQPLAADVIGADLGAQVKPDEHRDARAAHPQVGDVALELPAADDLDRRGG
jgi:hypothetical protein